MKKINHLLKSFLFVSLFFLSNQKVKAIDSYSPWDKEIVTLFKAMPVQEEGRLKPMQTVARYKLLRINNAKRLSFPINGEKIKVSATEWLLDCLFRPELAKEMPIFKINNPAVIESIGVKAHSSPRERYSYNEIFMVQDAMKILSERTNKLGEMMNDPDQEESSKKDRRDPINAGLLALKSAVNEFEWAVNAFNFARDGVNVDLGSISEEFQKSQNGKTKISYFVEQFDKIIEIARGPEGKDFIDQISGAFSLLERDTATAGVKDNVSMISLAMFPPQDNKDEEWLKPGYFIEQLTFKSNELTPDERKDFSSWAIPYLVSLEQLSRNVSNPDVFKGELQKLSDNVIKIATDREEYKNIKLELFSNEKNLFHWALPFYVMAFLLLAFSWLSPGSRFSRVLVVIVWGMAILQPLLL